MGHGRCLPRRTCEAHSGTRAQSGLCVLPHDIMFTARGGPRTAALLAAQICVSFPWMDRWTCGELEAVGLTTEPCLPEEGWFQLCCSASQSPWPQFPLWAVESGFCASSEGALLQQHKVRPSNCSAERKANFFPLGRGCSLLSQDRCCVKLRLFGKINNVQSYLHRLTKEC